jgi:elongation factor G
MAFQIAASMGLKAAFEKARPIILEPVMALEVSCPDECMGDVIGDLNSRRGRPLGMEPGGGGMTEVKAEVPMSEMLSYAPDLRSITGGRGEFAMEFLRYEEVPGHLAGKVVDEARAERDAVRA